MSETLRTSFIILQPLCLSLKYLRRWLSINVPLIQDFENHIKKIILLLLSLKNPLMPLGKSLWYILQYNSA